eukprot:4028164-Prorocentrum_lima.AAC.1
MTSSLVGSEMCIRDRSDSPRLLQFRVGSSSHRESSEECSLFGALTAVSYTHLTLPTICSV